MRADEVVVEVRDKTLTRRGQIPTGLLDLDATLVASGVGSWRLRLPTSVPGRPEVAAMADLLRTPGSGLVVTHVDPAVGVLFSGPMQTPEAKAGASDPAGTLTVQGVTDDVLLFKRRAYGQPSIADVSAQTVGWDVRTGVAETVMRAYVDANMGPSAPVSRRVSLLTLAPDLGRGPSVTRSERFTVLGEVLQEIGTVAGLGFRVVQVGDVLQFQVYAPTDRTGLVRLDVRNGTLSEQSASVSPPSVTRAIVAGQGEGADRTLLERTTAESLAAEEEWGPWGRVESFIDQRQTDDLTELQQAGDKALAEGGATTTTVRAVPADDLTMRYPIDWGLGDRVTVIVDGQETTSRVASAQIILDASGVRVGAGLGEVTGWSPPASRREVAQVTARVSQLERNAEAAAQFDASAVVSGVLDPARLGGAWATYTPTLTASTTNPNLGSTGTIVAAFTRVGKTVHWRAVLQSGGTGISAGSGTYNLTLPVAIRAGLPFPIVGSGWMYGNGGVFTPLVMDGNPGRLLMPSGAFLSHTQGFTAAGHVLSLSGTYEGD